MRIKNVNCFIKHPFPTAQ